MEINTCEQYVLQKLVDAEEKIMELEMEVANLKADLAEATRTIRKYEEEN